MTTQSTVSRYLRLLLRQSPEQKRADAVLAGEATAQRGELVELATRLQRRRRPDDYSRARLLLEKADEALAGELGEADGQQQIDRLRGELAEVLVAQATCAVHDPRAKEPVALLRLAKRLRRRSFPINLARRLLRTKFWDDEKEEVLRELAPGLDGEQLERLRREIRAELALVTALATDLSADYRLRRAMAVLQSGGSGPDDPAADRTTLQRAGFICKQLWERGLRESELRQACDYYRRAMDAAETPADRLSSAAEVAYLLDVQAEVERGGRGGGGGEAHIAEADDLRRRILAELSGSEELQGRFRSLINLAQMHFGLQQWDEARALLEKARGLKNIPGWLLENTARELVLRGRYSREMAQDERILESEPGRVLLEFLGQREHVLRLAAAGKVGLALSGGGFRASFFHLGMLARLAELDLLRHVEVLSCVSGGSVIGAHYYLKLRQLLASHTDEELVGPEPYVRLVDELIDEFCAGARRNIRTRLVTNLWANLRMALPRSAYSRTDRAGELFERFLFRQVNHGLGLRPLAGKLLGWLLRSERSVGRRRAWLLAWIEFHLRRPWLLTDLTIVPRGERAGFRPALDNWKRRHKVPMLILNATTLNTGHNWQFTATWMGESPAAIDPQVDSNYRLRRLYLAREAPPPHRLTTLGKAVAASAGVPALFDPTTLRELYEDKLVRLVDGGVFDNQGTASLLEQDCRVMLVSDASGQMDSDDHPSPSPLRVPFRANAILMNRVRQAQYRDLKVREEADLLRHVFYIDLRKDLEGEPVDWVDCVDPKKVPRDRHRSQQPRAAGSERRTSYGVIAGLQRKLSDIRTDLDTFCDAEAFALMASGYRQARLEGGRLLERVNELAGEPGRPPEHHWPFLGDIDGLLSGQRPESERRRKLERLLEVAHERLFRIWRLWLTQQWTRWLFFAALAAGLLVVARFSWTALFEPQYLVELLREWVHDEDHLAIRVETLAAALKVLIGLVVLMPLALVVVPLFPRLLGTLVHSVQLLMLGTIGWAIAWLHLLLFDPWYRRWLPVRPEPPPAGHDPLPGGQVRLTG